MISRPILLSRVLSCDVMITVHIAFQPFRYFSILTFKFAIKMKKILIFNAGQIVEQKESGYSSFQRLRMMRAENGDRIF